MINYSYNPYLPDWEVEKAELLPLLEQSGQQNGGLNPMQGWNMYQQFAGGESVAGSSAGSGSSWMASMGPWAALAAIIAINENHAQKNGYRDEKTSDYALDLIDGKVFEQDAHQRWAPALDKLDGKLGTNTGDTMRMVGDLATFDFSNAGKSFEDSLKKDPLVKGILSLFS
ncbi:hypothetical protein [Microbulbifer sp. TYP-18]|uniref:hypothetical protein n=1 Tax=Microbulbifer sp. TYP-18 TaxID=3230024 RepID=UPI0034C63DD6